MRRWLIGVASGALIFGYGVAQAARDCNPSLPNVIEKDLCERPELAKLDEGLNRAYSNALARSDAPEFL